MLAYLQASGLLFEVANYTAPTIFGHFCDGILRFRMPVADRLDACPVAACGRRRGGILANMVQVVSLVQIMGKSGKYYGHTGFLE